MKQGGKQPAFQFYTGDWLKDPALSLCSPATRGIWIDLLSRMHENNRSGVVGGSVEGLARLARASEEDLRAALVELARCRAAIVTIEDDRGVRDLSDDCPAFVRDLSAAFPGGRHTHVTVTNRRMKREAEERAKAAQRKDLERQRKTSARASPKTRHGPVTQKSRSLSSSSSSTSVFSASQKPPLPPVLDTEEFRQAWADWTQHRHEKRASLTPTATKKQLTQLEAMGHDRAIAALRHSTANGYTGVYEPGSNTANGSQADKRRERHQQTTYARVGDIPRL